MYSRHLNSPMPHMIRVLGDINNQLQTEQPKKICSSYKKYYRCLTDIAKRNNYSNYIINAHNFSKVEWQIINQSRSKNQICKINPIIQVLHQMILTTISHPSLQISCQRSQQSTKKSTVYLR